MEIFDLDNIRDLKGEIKGIARKFHYNLHTARLMQEDLMM
jgi:hypothetical protein